MEFHLICTTFVARTMKETEGPVAEKQRYLILDALRGFALMGIALASLDVPVQKQNNGLTLLVDDENEQAEKIQAILK